MHFNAFHASRETSSAFYPIFAPTLTEAKVSLSLVAAWTAEARILQNADKLKHAKLRCLGVLCLNMWRSSSVVLRLYWVSCEFFQRVGGSCFGTFDAWGGKAARGRCCRFEEQHPLVLLCTWDPLRFAKETWGTKRTKKDQIEENWDEIAEKRKNWNTTRTSDRSILGVPLKILFLLKGLVEAFLECIYATEKQIPGWRCIMWYSKIVPHMSLTDLLLIPDQDICGLAKCELLLLAHALPGIHQLFS